VPFASLENPYPSLGRPSMFVASSPSRFSSWITASAYVPGAMFTKSQVALVARTWTIMIFVAKRKNSLGKPCGPWNSAHATAPMLLRIPRISTCNPGLVDSCGDQAVPVRAATITPATATDFRMDIGVRVYLTIGVSGHRLSVTILP